MSERVKSTIAKAFVFLCFVAVPCLGVAASFSGGGGTSDDFAPADGTLNVTGNVQVSDGSYFRAHAGEGLYNVSHSAPAIQLGSGGFTDPNILTWGGINNASSVAWRIAASPDLTAGKILSIGDNAGTSYAEKLAVDYNGDLVPADATLNVTGSVQATGNFYAATGQYFGSANGNVQFGNTGNVASVSSTSNHVDLDPGANYPVKISTDGTKVACSATYRGSIFYEPGGAGVADAWYRCQKDAADAYAWVAF